MAASKSSVAEAGRATRELASCPRCGTRGVAPEWSTFDNERGLVHHWECAHCGYSFETVASGGGEARQVPAPRAKPDLIDRLLRRGYSESEIFALAVPKRTLARRRAAGEPLSLEETDKALRLERTAAHAERVFGDPEKAHRWLRKPKRTLNGETPLAFLASEEGARKVEEMLYRIDHGIAA